MQELKQRSGASCEVSMRVGNICSADEGALHVALPVGGHHRHMLPTVCMPTFIGENEEQADCGLHFSDPLLQPACGACLCSSQHKKEGQLTARCLGADTHSSMCRHMGALQELRRGGAGGGGGAPGP